MTVPCRIPMYHNQNTVVAKRVLSRSYDVPTSWNAPDQKGIRRGATDDITMMYVPTPMKGIGDPRILGKRIVNPTLRTEMFVG